MWWNWKAALLSACCRAVIFLATNLPAGTVAGIRAMVTEFIFRVVASGFLGAATEACAQRNLSPRRTAAAVALITATGHVAEIGVHVLAGTERIRSAVAGSIAFTLVTTSFNLFAMRRGALTVGRRRASLLTDLRRLPGLSLEFIRTIWPLKRCI